MAGQAMMRMLLFWRKTWLAVDARCRAGREGLFELFVSTAGVLQDFRFWRIYDCNPCLNEPNCLCMNEHRVFVWATIATCVWMNTVCLYEQRLQPVFEWSPCVWMYVCKSVGHSTLLWLHKPALTEYFQLAQFDSVVVFRVSSISFWQAKIPSSQGL